MAESDMKIVIFGKEGRIGKTGKKIDMNTITSMSKGDEVLMLSNACLYVDNQGVEWIVNTVTSYHATTLGSHFPTIKLEIDTQSR